MQGVKVCHIMLSVAAISQRVDQFKRMPQERARNFHDSLFDWGIPLSAGERRF